MTVFIALNRHTLGLASQFHSFGGYEVLLTEEGGVAGGLNAGSTTTSRLVPVLGESRFSTFTISPAFLGLHGYSPAPLRWPYVYSEQSGFTLTARRLDLTTTATASAAASLGSGSGFTAMAACPESPYGYILRFNGEIRRWSIAAEPGAGTAVILAAGAHGRDFEGIRLDADGNLWLGQDRDGYIQKRDADGNLIFEAQVPGGPGSVDKYSNFAVPDSIDGAVVLNQRYDAGLGLNFSQWHWVDGTGTVTDITDNVTVDGDPWNTAVTTYFGSPGVNIGSHGDRICFNPENAAGMGTDLLYGTVSAAAPSAPSAWRVGRIGFPSGDTG